MLAHLELWKRKFYLNFSDDLLILNLYKHSAKFISPSLAYIVTLMFQLQRFLGAQRLFNYLLENNFQMQQGHHPFFTSTKFTSLFTLSTLSLHTQFCRDRSRFVMPKVLWLRRKLFKENCKLANTTLDENAFEWEASKI